MKFFDWLFGEEESNSTQVRDKRIREIKRLGFDLWDKRGWYEGAFAEKRYFLAKDDEIVAGPFSTTKEAVREAYTRRPSRANKARGS